MRSTVTVGGGRSPLALGPCTRCGFRHQLSKRPTPSEYAAIAVLISSALIVLGAIALVVAFRAPAEKHDTAIALMHYGGCSLGLGVFIAFAFESSF